jgi:hypothetical protein
VKGVRGRLEDRRGGRWVVGAGLAVGSGFLVGQVVAHDSAFGALVKACVSALLIMAVAGGAQAFWGGDRLEEAEAGGVRVKFGAARRAISELNRRVSSQMDDINRRLYDLESAVFKGAGPDSQPEEE